MFKKFSCLYMLFIAGILVEFMSFENIAFENAYYCIIFFIFIYLTILLYKKRFILYKIYYNKKFLIFFLILVCIGFTSTLINVGTNNIKFSNLGAYTFKIILLPIIVILALKLRGILEIKNFFYNILYTGCVLNIIGIYEIINRTNIYDKILNNESYLYIQLQNNIRVYSIFTHPILYGNFLICLFWINFIVKKNKKLFYFIEILTIINLIFTQSRSSWIGLFISILIYILNNIYLKYKNHNITLKIKYILITIIFVFVMIIIYKYLLNCIIFVLNRFRDMNNDISKLQRLGALKFVIDKQIENNVFLFLFGNGYNSVKKLMISTVIILNNFSTTDNEYASFIYDFGFVTTFIYLSIVIINTVDLLLNLDNNKISTISKYIFMCISINMFFYEVINIRSIVTLYIISIVILSIKKVGQICI